MKDMLAYDNEDLSCILVVEKNASFLRSNKDEGKG